MSHVFQEQAVPFCEAHTRTYLANFLNPRIPRVFNNSSVWPMIGTSPTYIPVNVWFLDSKAQIFLF